MEVIKQIYDIKQEMQDLRDKGTTICRNLDDILNVMKNPSVAMSTNSVQL